MRLARFGIAVFACTGLALLACATGTLPPDIFNGGDGGPDAVTTGDGAACPQFDLQTDPKHCGSCTKACAAAEVCSLGACKNQCDLPTVKCAGAQSCSDLTKDPKNCGQCATVCGGPDAGPDTGTGNPDAGIPVPDGGFDAGTGWSFGSPGCDGGKCALTCGAGTSLCTDSLCWDTQNAHDHCGDCSTACAADVEWCTKGHCCSSGKDYCGGACVDVFNDANNCGACGNKCGVSTPMCSSGVCSNTLSFGPVHTFVGQTSDFYISTGQGGCSVNGTAAVDAAYFCTHFYGTPLSKTCTPRAGYVQGTFSSASGWMMHKNGGCTSSGTDIPTATCDSGKCKMWNTGTSVSYGGLKNLICDCL